MPSKKFLRESQELTHAAIFEFGDASAYDIMDIVAAGKEGNEAFALRQRVSGACSELHSENRVHQVGTKVNPSSGETVKVYRANPYADQACPCGACPGGGEAGYKAKYEAALEEIKALKANTVPLCGSCICLLCDSCVRARGKAAA
jgi:hypothetical protein